VQGFAGTTENAGGDESHIPESCRC